MLLAVGQALFERRSALRGRDTCPLLLIEWSLRHSAKYFNSNSLAMPIIATLTSAFAWRDVDAVQAAV